MTFIDFLAEDNKDAKLVEGFNKLKSRFSKIKGRMSVISERGPAVGPAPGQVELGQGMDQAMRGMAIVAKQMRAAQDALSMINTMKDSEYRTKTRSRIMSNMNRIRGNINRIEKLLAAQD